MKFEYIWKLMHLLWIIPLFGILVYYASYRRKSLLKTIFGSNANNPDNTTLSHGKRYLKLWLLLSAIIFACFAVARPVWGWRILPFSDRGRDLLILLDVSKSMNSEDVKPSRLKHAKLFIRNLIKSNPGDRFGLISFAGSSFLECPLTVDKTSLFQELDELNTDSIPLGGTNIESALKTALMAFKAAEGGYRAIVLITDGDELYGDSTKAIAELKKKKIPLFVVGIGDPKGDGLIKMTNANGKTTLLRDSQGKLVKSRLNEAGLKKLSDATGGIYVRSTETQPELAAINKRVHALVPKEYSKGSSKRPIERFHYPLAASVLLLLIWFAIGERKSPRTMLLFATFATASLLTPVQVSAQDNNKLLTGAPVEKKTQQTPPAASENKKEKKTAIATSADIYNRALLAQKSNKISEAVKLYKQAVNMSKVAPEVRSKAFQNLGVISHSEARAVMQKKPDEALKILDKAEVMYKEAMRSAPSRKSVVLNQQKLIDDRELAKQIKKKKEELKKKQQQAQKKTKEAHDQQKKENQQKKQQQCNKNQNNQQKKDQNQNKQQQNKQQQKQNCQNKQNQQQNKNNSSDKQQKKEQKENSNQNRQTGNSHEQNHQEKQNKQSKGDQGQKSQQNKQNAGKQQQNSSSSSSAKTEQKIKEAEQACNDLKKAADQHKRQDISKQASEAEKELKKAEEEHKKGNGDKAEEHLKKALEKLQAGSDKNKDNKNSQKNKQSKGDQGQKDQNSKKNAQKQGDQKQNGQDRKLQKPQQKNQKGSQGKGGKKKAEKPIDPRQAAALLDLMANDEKTLLDKIKENQKRNARVKKVLKDW